MGKEEINQFLTHLAVHEHVSASTQNQALNALLFLYKRVLDKDVGLIEGVIRAKRSERLPLFLTPRESKQLIDHMEGLPALSCVLLFGSGSAQKTSTSIATK